MWPNPKNGPNHLFLCQYPCFKEWGKSFGDSQPGLLYTYIPISSDFSVSSFQCFIFVLQIVKTDVRELWNLEYEIEEIQTEFAKGIGSIDIANLTDDFVEDVMLQSKPLQGILMAIRLRQKVCIVLLTTIYALSLSNWNDCAP